MTESEWLAGVDPDPMVSFVRESVPSRKREDAGVLRKLRLFACGCCGEVWHLLPPEGRAAVELAEEAADGPVPGSTGPAMPSRTPCPTGIGPRTSPGPRPCSPP